MLGSTALAALATFASPSAIAQQGAVTIAAAELETGIVSAEKRDTDLQRTPIAISVASDDFLEKRHVDSLIDLASGSLPSLRVATFEARQSALTVGIRGIVPFGGQCRHAG